MGDTTKNDITGIVQHVGGTTDKVEEYIGPDRSIVVNKETKRIHIQDGENKGGVVVPNMNDIVPKENILQRIPLEFDLSDLDKYDANTMYPVYFVAGENKTSYTEIELYRRYNWNARNPSPFSDNSSTTHIAGLNLNIKASDNPWGGAGSKGLKVDIYKSSYMDTVQFIDYRIKGYGMPKGSTELDPNMIGENFNDYSRNHSGFYLRGGLKYVGWVKTPGYLLPTLIEKPTMILTSSSIPRDIWITPIPYKPENNIKQVDNIIGNTAMNEERVLSLIPSKSAFDYNRAKRIEELGGSGVTSYGENAGNESHYSNVGQDFYIAKEHSSTKYNMFQIGRIYKPHITGNKKFKMNVYGNDLTVISNSNEKWQSAQIRLNPIGTVHNENLLNLSKDYKQGDYIITNSNKKVNIFNNSMFDDLSNFDSDRCDIVKDDIGIKVTVNNTDYTNINLYISDKFKLVNGVKYNISFTVKADSKDIESSSIEDFSGASYHVHLEPISKGEEGSISIPFTYNDKVNRNILCIHISFGSDIAIGDTFHLTDISVDQVEGNSLAIASKTMPKGTNAFNVSRALNPVNKLSRKDLVILETWHENIEEKGMVYPFGSVQYIGTGETCLKGGSNGFFYKKYFNSKLPDVQEGTFEGSDEYSLLGNWQEKGALIGKGFIWDKLNDEQKKILANDPENNIYTNGSDIIQVRYRIRVIQGFGDNWSNVTGFLKDDLTGSICSWLKYGPEDRYGVIAKGKKCSILEDINDRVAYRGYFVGSNHFGTAVDRNNPIGSFSLGITPEEGEKVKVTDLTYDDTTVNAVPISLVQRRNSGIYHPTFNSNGTARLYNDGKAVMWFVNKDGLKSTEDCFDPYNIATINKDDITNASRLSMLNDGSDDPSIYVLTGIIDSNMSGRPDGLYVDAVSTRDIKDLRMSVEKIEDTRLLIRKEVDLIREGTTRGEESEFELVAEYNCKNKGVYTSTGRFLSINSYDDFSAINTRYPDKFNFSKGAWVYSVPGFKIDNVIMILHHPDVGTNVYRTCYVGNYYVGISSNENNYNSIDKYANLENVNVKIFTNLYNTTTSNEIIAKNVIIGDPKNYPTQWSTDGFTGKPLLLNRDNELITPKTLSHDNTFTVELEDSIIKTLIPLVILEDGSIVPITSNDGISRSKINECTIKYTIDDYNMLGYDSLEEALDKIVIIENFTTRSKLLKTDTNSVVIDYSADAYATSDGHKNIFTNNLIGKTIVNVTNDDIVTLPIDTGMGLYHPYGSGEIFKKEDLVYQSITHRDPNIKSKSGAGVKFLPYLSKKNGISKLNFIFKEMRVKKGEVMHKAVPVGSVFGSFGGPTVYKYGCVLPLEKSISDYRPSILYHNNEYLMWVSSKIPGDSSYMHFAKSKDGLNWTKVGPIVDNNNKMYRVSHVSVIRLDNEFVMYYSYRNPDNNSVYIYRTTSNDGINWGASTKVIDHDNDDGTTHAMGTIMKDDGVYKMWYNVTYDDAHSINYAESSDGLSWTDVVTKCITPNEDEKIANDANVIKDINGVYHMWYNGSHIANSQHKLYYARSEDGKTWSRGGEVLPIGDANDYDSYSSMCAGIVSINGIFKIWYSGINNDHTSRILLASTELIDVVPHNEWGDNNVIDVIDNDGFKRDNNDMVVRYGQKSITLNRFA